MWKHGWSYRQLQEEVLLPLADAASSVGADGHPRRRRRDPHRPGVSWDFSTDPEFAGKLAWVKDFVRQEIMPLETAALGWQAFRIAIQPLSAKVKEQGLWAAHLGPELGGAGYGQVKLALLHEQLGVCELAPPVFGNAAPDSGNSELIAIAGTPEQKRRWLQPLLDGRIFSAFSITEQGTGSDPRQFATAAKRDGDGWLLDGVKWCVGNATRSDFHIVMRAPIPIPRLTPTARCRCSSCPSRALASRCVT